MDSLTGVLFWRVLPAKAKVHSLLVLMVTMDQRQLSIQLSSLWDQADGGAAAPSPGGIAG